MTVRAEFERQWTDWLSRLRAIPPERTRESGVAGKWTAHDVVNHVHVCARYYLSQARGAFSGVDPTEEDWYGPRVAPEEGLLPEDGSTDTRNENIRRRGQSVSWDYLLGEAAWLRAESLAWVDGHSAADLDEPLGWSPVWDRALGRRALLGRSGRWAPSDRREPSGHSRSSGRRSPSGGPTAMDRR